MAPVIDLNHWHRALHRVTGDMALKFNKATADDLKSWVRMLRTIADEMNGECNGKNMASLPSGGVGGGENGVPTSARR
jgi:hypothetical protein